MSACNKQRREAGEHHETVVDWLHGTLCGKDLRSDHSCIAHIKAGGDGPWSECAWMPTVGPGQTYF